MAERDMRKLNRRELLELLLKQGTELQRLREQLDKAETALSSRVLQINEAGSIAEAALRLNGVFEAAQAACSQYTESVALLSRRQEELCLQMEQESRDRAAAIVAEAEERGAQLVQEAQERCQRLLAEADARQAAV